MTASGHSYTTFNTTGAVRAGLSLNGKIYSCVSIYALSTICNLRLV